MVNRCDPLGKSHCFDQYVNMQHLNYQNSLRIQTYFSCQAVGRNILSTQTKALTSIQDITPLWNIPCNDASQIRTKIAVPESEWYVACTSREHHLFLFLDYRRWATRRELLNLLLCLQSCRAAFHAAIGIRMIGLERKVLHFSRAASQLPSRQGCVKNENTYSQITTWELSDITMDIIHNKNNESSVAP